ncbi:MAG: hypothetical protein ABSG31_10545 [Tepidisphaeraceae bacterium]|jgi:hypothetical protein
MPDVWVILGMLVLSMLPAIVLGLLLFRPSRNWLNAVFIVPFQLRSHRITSELDWEALDLSELQANLLKHFSSTAQSFAALGFTAVGHCKGRSDVSSTANLERYSSVWMRPETGDLAITHAVRDASKKSNPYRTVCAFGQHYADRTSITTTNRPSSSLPENPHRSILHLPGLSNLPKLYEIHRTRVVREARGRTPKLPTDVVEFLSQERLDHRDQLVNAGFHIFDSKANGYRWTWRAAFLIPYRSIWPMKQRRIAAGRIRTDQMLKELGFGDLKSLVSTPPSLSAGTEVKVQYRSASS